MTSVGLSLFNYQDDARSNKRKIYSPIFQMITSLKFFNPKFCTAFKILPGSLLYFLFANLNVRLFRFLFTSMLGPNSLLDACTALLTPKPLLPPDTSVTNMVYLFKCCTLAVCGRLKHDIVYIYYNQHYAHDWSG